MSRLDDVLNTLNTAIGNAIEAAGVVGSTFVNLKGETITVEGGQIFRGNPLVTEYVNIAAQGDGYWQISTYPLRPKRTTRWSGYDSPVLVAPNTPLSASIDEGVIIFTLTGSMAVCNVHTVINGDADAYIQTVTGDTVDTVATKVANAINTLDLEGVSAVASTNHVTVTGATISLFCNVGGFGSISHEVGRFERLVDVKIWANDPHTRSLLEEAIEENVGGSLLSFLALPDNTGLYVKDTGVSWDDDSQGSYSIYIGHIMLNVEYGVMQTVQSTLVGAIQVQQAINGVSAPNQVIGGP